MKRDPALTDFTKDGLLRWMDTAISSDVFGSYTGLTEDGETPIQDADDL